MTFLVNSIGHMQINVTDPDAVAKDLTEILGLHVTHRGADQTWLSSNGRAVELVLRHARENAAYQVGLEAPSAAAVREASRRVAEAGCRIVSEVPSLSCVSDAVTFATPEGFAIEIHTPIRDDINRRRHPTTGVGVLRMDHINILSPDPVATREQLFRIAGLRMSERLADDSLTWLYGGNRQHHIIGIVKGKLGLHHTSFEMQDFTSYLKLGDLMDQADKQLIWGPGRHRPGDNTYAYFLDASGAMIECSGNMSYIADDANFSPSVLANLARPGNVRQMNVWGTPAPLEWRTHHFPFASER